jgi:cell division protein FtsZ
LFYLILIISIVSLEDAKMGVESIINSALEPSSSVDMSRSRSERIDRNDEVDEELRKILESRKAEIKVVGVGGGGGNTISRLMQIGIVGAETIAVNTDAQDLLYTDADRKILIGKEITGGLGAGADPSVGAESAKESKEEIKKALEGADMVFVDCGLGGGTGTGAAPVVADIAKKVGALTVGIVTMPFTMEGNQRRRNAQTGLENLESVVDTLIVVPNDKLLEIVPDVSIVTAFKVADEILVNAVKGIAELITKPGLVNLDFADVRAVMTSGGLAMIGMGESDSENRAVESVEKSLSNPLLDVEIDGATGALINVCGGEGVTIRECQEIVEAVNNKINPDAKIIWGAQIDKALGDTVRTMLIITGVKSAQIYGPGKTYTQQKQKEIEKVLGIDFVSKR